MNQKLTFTPCEVEKVNFDEQLDVITSSGNNAKEGFSWWTNGDDEPWWN